MKVAIQINNLTDADVSCADRVYLGERFCAERYLKRLKEFAAWARECPAPVWLATPEIIGESAMRQVAEATFTAADAFEGVLVADPGLGMLLRGDCRLGFKGTLLNRESARRVSTLLEAEFLRLHPPTVDTMEALAGTVELEITVHGRIPLSSTPRCPTQGYRGCDACETEHAVEGGPAPLILRGNTLYAADPVCAFGLIQRFEKAGVGMAVIEALHINGREIAELAKIYRGESPPPHRRSSGMFFGREAEESYLISAPWMCERQAP